MTDVAPDLSGQTGGRVFERAPRALAIATFLVGGFALISAALPGEGADGGMHLLDLFAEARGLALTFGGLALMALSLGLLRRLKTAWALAAFASFHGMVVTGFFKERLIECAIYAALLIGLVVARKAFYRRSALQDVKLTRVWFLGVFLCLAAAGFVSLLWVSHQQGFVEASFVDLVIDPALGVAGRPVAFALLIVALVAFFNLFARPLRRRAPAPLSADFEVLETLLGQSDASRPDNILAFSGDKSVFYGPDKAAAIAYAEIGGARIAMGPPIGPKNHWKSTIEAFQKDAEEASANAALYSVPPDLLPDLLDLDFSVEKIGENAVLDLPDFTLSGRKREVIRRGRRKLAEREGATFRLSFPPHDPQLIEQLRPVSEAWLADNGGREKAFSLGRFDAAFLDHCPIGVVEIKGRCAAFGTLFVTPDKSWAGIDLMRYDPDIAVTNTMDFLLVELILWAKLEDYAKFDLAMAPLSGLVEAEYAPLFARIGRFIYDRGERFYNFQGLRRFKQKFNPRWEPRYVAAPGYWSLPLVLAKAALLTNGAGDKTASDKLSA